MPSFWDWVSGNKTPDGRKGLGYRYVRDPRSDNYLMSGRLLEAPEPPPEKEHPLGPTLDQGEEGSCVGHGWGHWLNCGDVKTPLPRLNPVDHAYCVDIYNYAQSVDEWADTPPAEGTSVLAGAKACVQFKHLKEGYLWGQTTSDLINWLGNYGPVVMGSLWLSGMRPDANGFVPITGKIEGGHCYLCYGYMQVTSLGSPRIALKFQNSWGEDWGDGGKFYVWLEDYQALLNRGNYSMCTPLELAPEPVSPTPPDPPQPQVQRINLSLIQLYRNVDLYRGRHLTVTDSRSRYRPRWNLDPVNVSGGDLSGEEQKEGGSGQEGRQEQAQSLEG